jgi:hypothetical protein
MRKLLLIIILLAIAYVGGYWPEHQHLQEARRNLAQTQQRLAQAQDAARISHMENELLNVIDQTQAQNYGEAQKSSGQFFDDLNSETSSFPASPYISELKTIVARRDAVVSGLARADASTLSSLRQSLNDLRKITEQANAQATH